VSVACARHQRRSRAASVEWWVPLQIAERSAVMCGPARGEHIAKWLAHSSVLERTGARTPEGSPCPWLVPVTTWRMWPGVGRVRLCSAGGFWFRPVSSPSAWEELGRNPEQGPPPENPKGGEDPREHPAGGTLTPWCTARDSRGGQSPGTAAERAGSVFRRREHRWDKR